MFDDNTSEVEVRVRFPWAKKELRFTHGLDRLMYECFQPRPRDRELDSWRIIEERKTLERREETASILGKMIASSILIAVEKEDTVNGYRKG